MNLLDFLKGFEEQKNSVCFCHFSDYFREYWKILEKRVSLKDKASHFLSENGLKHLWITPILHERQDPDLVALFEKKEVNNIQSHKDIRIIFLKWCIVEGFENLEDLFL